MRRGTSLPVVPHVELVLHVRGAGKEDASAQIQVSSTVRFVAGWRADGGCLRRPCDSHRRAATLEDRMHQLETLIQAIPPAVFAAGGVMSSNGVAPSPIDPTSNPHASFASSTHTYPTGVPPPSLNTYPLINPSTFFGPGKSRSRHSSPAANGHSNGMASMTDRLADETARMSLSPNYLYFDDEGYTRWQGETSGLPVLDLLLERRKIVAKQEPGQPDPPTLSHNWANAHAINDWFPDRPQRRTETNPEVIWKLITSFIAPDLMDRLVVIQLSLITRLIDLSTTVAWSSVTSLLLTIYCRSSTSRRSLRYVFLSLFLFVHELMRPRITAIHENGENQVSQRLSSRSVVYRLDTSTIPAYGQTLPMETRQEPNGSTSLDVFALCRPPTGRRSTAYKLS